ncbi:MAG TPA: hypothetical protein VFZ59_05800 [Verrucomicrobiae bacterium]|nr:hypothetical protein [Verrucomicrobiae bacterium]
MKTTLRSMQIALVALGLTVPAMLHADQQVMTKYSMPVKVMGKVTTTGCQNSPGPQITLEGQLLLGGMQVELIFQNNEKGTHTASVTYTNVAFLELGDAITLPKQPVLGGVGGNPHIWIQFHDGEGKNLTKEIYLGRCVQGLEISPELLCEVVALADVAALDCSNNPGPFITVDGNLTFSGLYARFIFRNNMKGTHTATVEDRQDVQLIMKGSQVTIPKQPPLGGAGGNPIISIQFQDGAGDAIGKPIKLGRCVQL